jgi:hypothetical protein
VIEDGGRDGRDRGRIQSRGVAADARERRDGTRTATMRRRGWMVTTREGMRGRVMKSRRS